MFFVSSYYNILLTYWLIDVKALIQFTVNVEEETFEATYFSLNDIPQTTTDLYGLIDKVFSDYRDSHE